MDIKDALKEAENKEVHVHINSFGGNIYAGIAISNMIKNHKSKTIAYIDGIAASAASIIAFGCDEIILPSNAYLMIHRAWGKVSGNAGDLEKYIDVLNKLDEGLVNAYMEKAIEGVTREQIYDFMKEEKWFTGEDAPEVFNIKTSEKVEFLNCIETKNKFKHIPESLLNKKIGEVKSKKEQARLDKLNKEIEIAARRDFDLIMNTTMQGTNSMVSGIINGKMPLSSSDKNIEKKMKSFYNDLFNIMMKKSKTNIEKIRYVKNDVAEITLEFKIPNTTENFQKYTESMITELLSNKNLDKMSENEFMEKFMTKMFNDMKKMYENTNSYMSVKGTIYLEKDNGKWAVAELDEKLKNYREMYKITKE